VIDSVYVCQYAGLGRGWLSDAISGFYSRHYIIFSNLLIYFSVTYHITHNMLISSRRLVRLANV
jgi:hypothetical protein